MSDEDCPSWSVESPRRFVRARLDRMVDGELHSDEQRQILLACENDPRAWRDLALAYVEAQALTAELLTISRAAGATQSLAIFPGPRGASASDCGTADVTANPSIVSDRRPARSLAVPNGPFHSAGTSLVEPAWPTGVRARTWRTSGSQAWALVASLLCMLAAGYGLGLWWHGGSSDAIRNGAPVALLPGANSPSREVPGSDGGQTAGDRPAGMANSQFQRGDLSTAGGSPVADDRMQLTVMDPGSGEWQQVEVPVFSSENYDRWARGPARALPLDVVEALRQRGHRVEQQRRFFRIRRPDGRRVLVPVDDLRIEFVDFQ